MVLKIVPYVGGKKHKGILVSDVIHIFFKVW